MTHPRASADPRTPSTPLESDPPAAPDSPKRVDVVIVGAGPAGACAAAHLAEAGRSVLIVEKAHLPRRKVCAGGLVRRAYQHLPQGLDFPVQAVCDRLESRVQGSGIHLVEREADLIKMVDRHHFDHALVQHAVCLGAELWQGTSAHAVEHDAQGATLDTSAGRVQADYVVLAEGANSQIANQIWGHQPRNIPALEIDVYASPDVLAAYQGRAIFDLAAIAEGYGWIFYKGDHLSVGVTSYRQGKVDVRGALQAYLSLNGLDQPDQQRNRRGFVIPVRPRQDLVRQRVILVGDTAGLADPISAEGLSYAIISGRAAAQAIAQHADHPQRVAARYLELIRAPILDELASARRLALLLYRLPWLRNLLLRRLGPHCQKAMRLVISGQRRFADLASFRRIARYLVSG